MASSSCVVTGACASIYRLVWKELSSDLLEYIVLIVSDSKIQELPFFHKSKSKFS